MQSNADANSKTSSIVISQLQILRALRRFRNTSSSRWLVPSVALKSLCSTDRARGNPGVKFYSTTSFFGMHLTSLAICSWMRTKLFQNTLGVYRDFLFKPEAKKGVF